MANPIENLSPEEKLLRVIQGGKKAKGGPESPPAAAARPVSPDAVAPPASVVAPQAHTAAARPATPEPAAEKPKLKVAKGTEAAEAPAGTTVDAKSAHKPRGSGSITPKGSASGLVALSKSAEAEGGDFSVRAVNIVLAVAALIVLFMTGREIWANVRVQGADLHVGPVSLPPIDLAKSGAVMLPLEDVLDAIDQRPLFAVVTPGPAPTATAVQAPGPNQYCSLLGISVDPDGKTEAIIMDKNINKMMYLKVDDVIAGDGQTWTVHEIKGDEVIFRSGTKECVVR